jgi:hypothetical protein
MWLPFESRLLLATAAAVVPSSRRSEWRREWEAELWCWMQGLPNAGRSLLERVQLAIHCCGAMSDAMCIRRADDGFGTRLQRLAGTPGMWVAAAVLGLVALALATGGFRHTRQALIKGPIPDAAGTAVLSQSSPFMGGRFGVPARKVDYWDRHAQTIDGAAVYVWYSSLAGRSRSDVQEVAAAKVGPTFFELLRARAGSGRVFRSTDAKGCNDCVVLGYDYWRKAFDGDPNITGRTVVVDGEPARVIGVLARDFWFLDVHPAVWTLYEPDVTWRSFPGILGGAVCNMKPGVSPLAVETELRVLAKQVKPTLSGAWVTVMPLREITARPVAMLAPAWGCLVVASLLFAVGLWVSAVLREGHSWSAARYPAFLLLKCILSLTIVMLATGEFCAAAFMSSIGGAVFAGGIASLWAALVGSAGALYLCWRDQRKRCRTCLCRLTMPVRMGYGARQLFEQSGAETVCPNGHGILFESEGGAFPPEYRWAPLDISWRDLFRPTEKTKL